MKSVKCLFAVGAALGALAAAVDPSRAQEWTVASAPATNWSSVACSADGSKIVAAVYGGLIYTSADYGASWTPTAAPTASWTSIACSADGTTCLAMASDAGVIYTTNSGAAWMLIGDLNPGGYWNGFLVAESADGATLVAASSPIPICISTNAGAAWFQTDFDLPIGWNIRSLGLSADGGELLIGAAGINAAELLIYNSGSQYPPFEAYTYGYGFGAASVALSADGTRLIDTDGYIRISTNSGATWTAAVSQGPWTLVASSADGTKLVAACGGASGVIITSADSGATWTASGAPSTNWAAVASSADGSRLVAAVGGGLIHTFLSRPVSTLRISFLQDNLTISWIVPSAPFVLEQSADLIDWAEVAMTPTLNYSTLRDELTLAAQPGKMFYRLVPR